MSSGVKTSLQLQRNQPKVIKPGKFGLSSTWNPSVPKSQFADTENLNSIIDEDENDEIRIRLRNEDIFDSIMDKILNVPIEQALEGPLKTLFNCSACIFWIDNPNDMTLYSPSRNTTVGLTNSVVGYSRLTRSVIQIQNQQQCPPNFIVNASLEIPENSKHIFIPITSLDIVYGVIQIIRTPEMPFFSETDFDSVTFVMNKFSLIGNCIFNTFHLCDLSLSFFQKKGQPSPHILETIEKYFQCKSAELWKYEPNSGYYFFDRQTNELNLIESSDIGITGQSLSKSSIINERMSSNHPSHSSPFDGNVEGPILVVPYEKNKREIWALSLRGRSRSFNVYDENEVKSIMPFVVRAAVNCSSVGEDMASILASLLDSASRMASSLNFSELIELIQRQSTQLIECEKAVILLADKEKSYFARGSDFVYAGELRSDAKIPIGEGIASVCFGKRKIVNIFDPKSDTLYSEKVDCCVPDLDPSMILASPLLDLRDEAVGVLLLYNKNSAPKFTENDEKVAAAFNVFAGIAIENAKHYQVVSSFASSLIKCVDESLLAEKVDAKTVLSNLMEQVLNVTFCDRITLFVRKTINELTPLINVGCESSLGSKFANEAAQKKCPLFLNSDKLDSKSSCINSTKDRSSVVMNSHSRSSLISGLLDQKRSANYKFKSGSSDENVYDFPIVNGELSVVGVIEYHFFNGRSEFDLNFFNEFGSLCEFFIPKFEPLPVEMAASGYGKFEVSEVIDNDELLTYKTPLKLQLDNIKAAFLYSLSFDVDGYSQLDLFKIVFSIFSKFELFEAFEISNEKLFHFLRGVRQKYRKEPFRNWRDAIDALQFVAYGIIEGEIDKVCSKDQILSILIAVICHDMSNGYFEKKLANCSIENDTLLSRFCGFSEIENCLCLFSVFSDDESNLLIKVSQEQRKPILEAVVELILSTNMSHHFTIFNEFVSLSNSGELDLEENAQHKLLLMKIVVKCGMLCSTARPFDVAKKRFDYVADDFYRRGEIERAAGIVFESPNMNREEINKPKSLVGFLKNVAQPLFQELGKQISPLSMLADKINDNISKYEKLVGLKK